MTIIDDLSITLREFLQMHQAKESAYQVKTDSQAKYDVIEAELMASIIDAVDDKGKPRYSNDDKRKAELQRRLFDGQFDCVNDLTLANHRYLAASNDCERAYESLKTLRALLAYQTSENQLEAARLQASTAVTTAELQAQADARELHQLTSLTISHTPSRLPTQPLPTKRKSSYDQFAGPDGDDLPF